MAGVNDASEGPQSRDALGSGRRLNGAHGNIQAVLHTGGGPGIRGVHRRASGSINGHQSRDAPGSGQRLNAPT